MKKPKNYHLERIDSRYYLDLECFEADGHNYLKRFCSLNVGHGYEFSAKTAKTMGNRLLEISKWLSQPQGENGE